MKSNIPDSDKQRVVIAGGGFAGLNLCETLRKKGFQVVLIDVHNFHQFQPLFYQVATAGLEPSSIVFPFRKIFQDHPDFYVRYGSVDKVLPERKVVQTTFGEVEYDYFVVATGAGNNFFGNEHIANLSLPMKSISEALSLRNAIFENFEKAITASSEEERQMYLNLVVVGGGPTGVEVSGTLAEMKRYILPKDYPDLDFSQMHIILVEGTDKVLNGMSEKSSGKALSYLRKLGVEIRLNSLVSDYDGKTVQLKNGETINCASLVWAAGITGNLIDGFDKDLIQRGGRVLTNAFSQVQGYSDIFAIGDISLMHGDPDYEKGHPQLAQVAIQQAKHLGKNLIRKKEGKQFKPFRYKNLGSMATVGRNKAVVDLPRHSFGGFFAWLVWMLVHLRSILGVKNKILVFFNWVWNYMTYNLSLRLIIQRPLKRSLEEEVKKREEFQDT